MKFFGMNNVNDKPTKNSFDDRMKDQIKSVNQRYLHSVIKRFICTYVIDMEMFMTHFSNIDLLQEWEAYQKSQVANEDGRFPCRFTGCKASFRYDGRS